VASELTVVKVGGSLYDLPDLGRRFRQWLIGLKADVVVVPGGGRTADAVRELDHWQNFGEEMSHWLALRALSLNAHFLASLLFPSTLAGGWQGFSVPPRGIVPVLDALSFMQEDEERPDHLPHTWDVTGDSVAARFAIVSGARSLVLLKSVTIPPEMSWAEASQLGLVDVMFPRLIERAGPGLRVEAVNFREWQP
jgi:5-(aminomethyl)-3-furanmethanol phosphate kinase